MHLPRHPHPVELGEPGRIPFLFVLREMEEAGEGDAGLALWQLLRNVRLRLDTPPRAGERLLGEGGGGRDLLDAVPALRSTLHTMDRLLREDEPDRETWDGLVLGCAHVGLWAEGAGGCRTALAFLQVAEEMDRSRPHLGYHVGRLARKLAFYDEAEAWLRWAYRLARARKEWEVAALCMSGLGNLYRQKGNLPRARRHHEFCLRIARRHELRTLEGDALYDLAGMSFDAGDERVAGEYVRAAIACYGPGHTRIYALAHDIAWFWMDRFGVFGSAAALLLELLNYLWEPRRRVLALAHLTRAAAAAGWSEVYEVSWNETWTLMKQQPTRDAHAGALTELALAAGNCGQWERARIAACEALKVAEARREGEMIIQAASILETLEEEGPYFNEGVCLVFKDRPKMRDVREEPRGAALETEIAGAMKARRDGAPESPTRALTAV